MFSERVHLGDRSAALEQRVGGLLLVGERQARGGKRQQRRAAAGDEKKNQIALGAPASQLGDPSCAVEPGRVGNRMAGFDDLDLLERNAVAILDDDNTAGDPLAEQIFERQRHARARLAAARDDKSFNPSEIVISRARAKASAVQPYMG